MPHLYVAGTPCDGDESDSASGSESGSDPDDTDTLTAAVEQQLALAPGAVEAPPPESNISRSESPGDVPAQIT